MRRGRRFDYQTITVNKLMSDPTAGRPLAARNGSSSADPSADASRELIRHRVHLDQTPVAVMETDAQGRVTAWNAAAERMLGWPAREVIGRALSELQVVHPGDWPAVDRVRRELENGAQESIPHVNRNVRRDGRVLHCEWHNAAIRDETGELVSILAVGLDVTERTRAQEALRERERHWHGVVDAIPQLVWSATADGACDYVSRQWLEYTGAAEGEPLGHRWLEAFHEEDRAAVHEAWLDLVTRGAPFDLEVRMRRGDGTHRWFKARAVGIRDAGVVRWLGSCTDIDAAVNAREAHREADRRKDEFLAVLAHELRNPLAPLRTGLHVLARSGQETARAARARTVMSRQVEHLTRLVNDLLDQARIGGRRMALALAPLDLREVVRATVEDHALALEAGDLALTVHLPDEPLAAMADRARLAQALGNLLENAVKYTPSGGAVAVTLTRDGEAACITVRDTGEGIPPELLHGMLEPFRQGPQSLARSRGGLGLGLSLAKEILSLQGATLELRSDGPGRGSTATVRLPLLRGAPAREVAPAARAAPRPVHLLVVEDNLDAAETLRDALELEGHRVTVAHDAERGLAAAAADPPDLVLCDIGLPGELDGYGFARIARADPSLRAVPLVALTGYGSPEDRRRALAAGFARHLAKPASLDEILRAIAELAPGRARPAGAA